MSQTIGHPVWREVLATRQRWHALHLGESVDIEQWPASADEWSLMLLGTANAVQHPDVDPRAMLIEVMAIASAWVDAMDERPGVDQ